MYSNDIMSLIHLVISTTHTLYWILNEDILFYGKYIALHFINEFTSFFISFIDTFWNLFINISLANVSILNLIFTLRYYWNLLFMYYSREICFGLHKSYKITEFTEALYNWDIFVQSRKVLYNFIIITDFLNECTIFL